MILDFHSVTIIIIHFAIFNACVVLFQIPILSEQQKTVNSSFFNFVHFWKKRILFKPTIDKPGDALSKNLITASSVEYHFYKIILY